MAGRVHTSRRRTRSMSTYRKHSPSNIPPSQHIRANLRHRTAQPGRDRQSTRHSPFSYISQLRSSVHHVQSPDELRGAEEQLPAGGRSPEEELKRVDSHVLGVTDHHHSPGPARLQVAQRCHSNSSTRAFFSPRSNSRSSMNPRSVCRTQNPDLPEPPGRGFVATAWSLRDAKGYGVVRLEKC